MESISKVEIINGLRKYNLTNRSIRRCKEGKPIGCAYTDDKGNHCGVGEYLLPEYQDSKFCHNTDAISCISNFKIYLIPEVHEHDLDFWRDIQMFHDTEDNFTAEGITEQGEVNLTTLIHRWGND